MRHVVIGIVAALAATAAWANAVTTEFKAGGLVFKKNDTIAIDSEELYVSFKQVRVAYVYRSKAPTAQNVTMAFPMPEVPIDDSPDSIIFNDDNIQDARNYMNFAVKVDGKPVTAKLTEVARLQGRDVTARLRNAGVPLIFNKGGQEAVAKLAKDARDALIRDKLLTGEEPSFQPEWKYQVLFEWEQSFRPGNTRVEISYKPITGDMADYGDYFDGPKSTREYCVDAAFRAALKRRKAAGASFDVYTLGYVLKTAQFWSGPIGKFRLVVDKERPGNLVAFCPLNSRKISETQFEWTATNFAPDRDLRVVFFYTGDN